MTTTTLVTAAQLSAGCFQLRNKFSHDLPDVGIIRQPRVVESQLWPEKAQDRDPVIGIITAAPAEHGDYKARKFIVREITGMVPEIARVGELIIPAGEFHVQAGGGAP
jgi:hypothetical protein